MKHKSDVQQWLQIYLLSSDDYKIMCYVMYWIIIAIQNTRTLIDPNKYGIKWVENDNNVFYEKDIDICINGKQSHEYTHLHILE